MPRPTPRDRRDARRHSKGFTHRETLVMAVIGVALVGLLLGVLLPSLLGPLLHESSDTVQFQLRSLGGAIEEFTLENHRLPASLEELTRPRPPTNAPYLKAIPRDPWNHVYAYAIVNEATREFRITGAGEDGRFGSDDDRVYPEQRAR